MRKVLLCLGFVFCTAGLLVTALGVTLMLMLQEPLLLSVAVPGMLFLLLGLAFLATVSRRRQEGVWLQQHGRRIDADLLGAQYDTRVRVNGRCPFVLQCRAVNPADGKVYLFASEELWFDPTPFLGGRKTMPVMVDPDNYHRYHVLTEGILPRRG